MDRETGRYVRDSVFVSYCSIEQLQVDGDSGLAVTWVIERRRENSVGGEKRFVARIDQPSPLLLYVRYLPMSHCETRG